MNDKYVEIIGDCFRQIIESTLDCPVTNFTIDVSNTSSPFVTGYYLNYLNHDSSTEGTVVIGITQANQGIQLASTIQSKVTTTSFNSFNNEAQDIVDDLLKTILERSITKWNKISFKARFQPVTPLSNKEFPLQAKPSSYKVNLEFGKTIFSLDVCHQEKLKENLSGKKIMVVDDSKLIRNILVKALENAGFVVEEAINGLDATVKYDTFLPDLTIMDIKMPELEGLQAIEKIRSKYPASQFVVLTSCSRTDEIILARSLNVKAYLIKPVQTEEFIDKIKKALDSSSHS